MAEGCPEPIPGAACLRRTTSIWKPSARQRAVVVTPVFTERDAASKTDRVHARLAELVAALSLGIDLGFGQPMEHVLRQCLIALRLAEG